MASLTINLFNVVAWVYTTKSDEVRSLVAKAVAEKIAALRIGPKGLRKSGEVEMPVGGWPQTVSFNQRGVLAWIESINNVLPMSATPGEKLKASEDVIALCKLHNALVDRESKSVKSK